MGFFGELKQDLSQVAGAEKKKEEAQLKAEDILAEAEVAGMDEAAEAVEASGEFAEDNDDVASLLKDLVSDLGGDDMNDEEVGESAFERTNLPSAKFGKKVKKVGRKAYYKCKKFKKLTVIS